MHGYQPQTQPGTLRVSVVNGNGLLGNHLYVIVELGTQRHRTKTNQVDPGGRVTWNEQMDFKVGMTPELCVMVKSQVSLAFDNDIGAAEVSIVRAIQKGRDHVEATIRTGAGQYVGAVNLHLAFEAAKPAKPVVTVARALEADLQDAPMDYGAPFDERWMEVSAGTGAARPPLPRSFNQAFIKVSTLDAIDNMYKRSSKQGGNPDSPSSSRSSSRGSGRSRKSSRSERRSRDSLSDKGERKSPRERDMKKKSEKSSSPRSVTSKATSTRLRGQPSSARVGSTGCASPSRYLGVCTPRMTPGTPVNAPFGSSTPRSLFGSSWGGSTAGDHVPGSAASTPRSLPMTPLSAALSGALTPSTKGQRPTVFLRGTVDPGLASDLTPALLASLEPKQNAAQMHAMTASRMSASFQSAKEAREAAAARAAAEAKKAEEKKKAAREAARRAAEQAAKEAAAAKEVAVAGAAGAAAAGKPAAATPAAKVEAEKRRSKFSLRRVQPVGGSGPGSPTLGSPRKAGVGSRGGSPPGSPTKASEAAKARVLAGARVSPRGLSLVGPRRLSAALARVRSKVVAHIRGGSAAAANAKSDKDAIAGAAGKAPAKVAGLGSLGCGKLAPTAASTLRAALEAEAEKQTAQAAQKVRGTSLGEDSPEGSTPATNAGTNEGANDGANEGAMDHVTLWTNAAAGYSTPVSMPDGAGRAASPCTSPESSTPGSAAKPAPELSPSVDPATPTVQTPAKNTVIIPIGGPAAATSRPSSIPQGLPLPTPRNTLPTPRSVTGTPRSRIPPSPRNASGPTSTDATTPASTLPTPSSTLAITAAHGPMDALPSEALDSISSHMISTAGDLALDTTDMDVLVSAPGQLQGGRAAASNHRLRQNARDISARDISARDISATPTAAAARASASANGSVVSHRRSATMSTATSAARSSHPSLAGRKMSTAEESAAASSRNGSFARSGSSVSGTTGRRGFSGRSSASSALVSHRSDVLMRSTSSLRTVGNGPIVGRPMWR